MRVRNAADHRTLMWAFILFPFVPVIDYLFPSAAPYLFPFGIYLSYCAGIFTHNHNHCPVFVGRRANRGYAMWLSFFYGLPIFTWIPTHNQNHHRFLNGDGDATRTSKHARDNTLLSAVTYPVASAYWQAGLVRGYVREARRRNRRHFRHICAQYGVVIGGHAATVGLAISLHGTAVGLSTYLLALGLPALFASWSMMFTNYLQHVDCDPRSPDNHSRNFVDPITNWFFFDAGYHTVHHENPGMHWSKYRALHRERAHAINPGLNEHSILTYCIKTYLFARISRRVQSRSLPI